MKMRLYGFAAAGVIGGSALAWSVTRRPDPTDLNYSASWLPTPAQIATRVGPATGPAGEQQRLTTFAEMFKLRYRKHDQAVGIRYRNPDRLSVLFAPILSRWQMAVVGIAAARESRALFAKEFKVEICETYISAPQRKIGEVHLDSRGHATVRFDPQFELEEARAAAQQPAQGGLPDPADAAPTRPNAVLSAGGSTRRRSPSPRVARPSL